MSSYAMADDKKNCQREEFEECKERRFLETVKRECGCIPWGLRVAIHGVEVTLSYQWLLPSIIFIVNCFSTVILFHHRD